MTKSAISIEVRPLTATCGAEIHGVDLAQPIDDATYLELRHALLDYGVIFFRDQAHRRPRAAAGSRAASASPTSFPSANARLPRRPPVHVLDFDGATDAEGKGADEWHTDVTFIPTPPMGTVLRAVVLPPLWRRHVLRQHECRVLTRCPRRCARCSTASRRCTTTASSRPSCSASDPVNGPSQARRTRQGQPAGRAPGRAYPPRLGSQGLVRQSQLHVAHRRFDRARERSVAPVSVRPRARPDVPVPVPVAAGLGWLSGTTVSYSTTRSPTTPRGGGCIGSSSRATSRIDGCRHVRKVLLRRSSSCGRRERRSTPVTSASTPSTCCSRCCVSPLASRHMHSLGIVDRLAAADVESDTDPE